MPENIMILDTVTQNSSIETWLAEATPEAAAKLDQFARSEGAKEVRKAARRALYLLSQRGIVPPAGTHADAPPAQVTERAETLHAWASAYDGAGNRLFLLVLTPPDGGNATVAQILANDELGIRDLSLERRRPREIAPLMERLEARIEDGLAVAEIEPDYARRLIDEFRQINLHRCRTTPSGFLDLLPKIGLSSKQATSHSRASKPTEDTLPSLTRRRIGDEVELGEADAVIIDPAELFKLTWFDPWFFAVEEVMPWLAAWIETNTGTDAAADNAAQGRRQAIATEAASALISDRLRSLYVIRLEESADILRKRGKLTEARQALFHAQAMKSEMPISEIPFAVALAARTLEAATEIEAAKQETLLPSGEAQR